MGSTMAIVRASALLSLLVVLVADQALPLQASIVEDYVKEGTDKTEFLPRKENVQVSTETVVQLDTEEMQLHGGISGVVPMIMGVLFCGAAGMICWLECCGAGKK